MAIDMQQFVQTFFEESFERLEVMESGLLELSQDAHASDPELVNSVFRAAHSIKGGSNTFGFGEVASLTHHLETLLDQMRAGDRDPEPAVIKVLLQSVDCLREMI
jgi:two-component system chemotaxis sensor kinase CheA